ncbi:hypothetical protein LJR234_002151 [Mesorhizobium amorphae]|uniref:hypothetical protein n=1 Tax=Mesorhizobium amorphae TaxID=71433 RepID=UPI003ECD1CB1
MAQNREHVGVKNRHNLKPTAFKPQNVNFSNADSIFFSGMGRGGKYAGSAFISLPKKLRERLWERVRKGRANAPAGLPKAVASPTVEWVKPGITARVKHLRGEAKLRHASLQDFRDESREQAAGRRP